MADTIQLYSRRIITMYFFKALLTVVFILGFWGRPARAAGPDTFQNVQRAPDEIWAVTETGSVELKPGQAGQWQGGNIIVTTKLKRAGLAVRLAAPDTAVESLHLQWQAGFAPDWRYLGDAWERAYGDLEWKPLDPQRVLPWYFLASNKHLTDGYGVQTGAGALCSWQAGLTNLTLVADVRCGGAGVQLGRRTLAVCTVISRRGQAGETPFAAAQAFCRQLCPEPRLPRQPVYGFNDWYGTYGHDTAAEFLKDTAALSALSPAKNNRPFAVVDDGWELNSRQENPWSGVNTNFSQTLTMPEFARSIRALGARPGLWFRPLLASAGQPQSWRLARNPSCLDPTVPAVRAYIQASVRQFHQWGFQLIKHDFSTYDLLGRWGFEMGDGVTTNGWAFADRSRTTAEVIRGLYQDIRAAAGDDTLITGCNTIGHLSAGIFEMQRIGDDTSGRDWGRTRKMGVNCLAFRAPQNGTFFAVDADCVGQMTTRPIPWSKNAQWLDLLAHSGTTVFVSLALDAVTDAQRQALAAALTQCARPQPTAEPVDWMQSRTPAHWILDGQKRVFAW